jgi:CheY-specific phosphatase CheX
MIDLKGNEISDDMLFQVVESVTDTFLKMPAIAASPPDVSAESELWTGTVSVTGGFNGALSLTCSRRFAHEAARTVFGDDFAENDAFAQDVLAELTNIVGGNVKCLFSEATATICAISIPSVSVGAVFHPDATLLTQLWAKCDSELLRVAIFESNGDRKPLS